MSRRSENRWLLHLFHRRCEHCYQEGYRAGWKHARAAELRAVAKTPDAQRDEMWIRERAS
jgi:Ribonuclease G/E